MLSTMPGLWGSSSYWGGGERGSPREVLAQQEASLPSHPGDAPALSSHLPSCLHRAVWVGLKAPFSSFRLDPPAVKNVPSEIPDVWAGGSKGERLTQVSDLRVGGVRLAGC